MPMELWPKAAGAFMESGKHSKRHKEGKCTPEMESGKGGWKEEENNLVPLIAKLKCSDVFGLPHGFCK